MVWNLDLKGAIVLACNVAGVGVIPAALHVVDVPAKILAADDPQVEAKNGVSQILSDERMQASRSFSSNGLLR